jgi:hypothetical protein
MNKIISSSKKAFNLLIAAVLLASVTLTAKANGPAEGDKNTGASTADVKYVGTLEGQPLFNVLYSNTNGDRFSIQVEDGDGNMLFQRSFTDKKFDKKFKLTDMGVAGKLVFIIRNYKDNSVQTFEANANSRMVEDVKVTEVK